MKPKSPKLSQNDANVVARQLLRHLNHRTPPKEQLLQRQPTSIVVTPPGSPVLSNVELQQIHLPHKRELQDKFELMQNLQAELLQMIEGQDESKGNSVKCTEDDNIAGLDGSFIDDDVMKKLLVEHTNLLKKALLRHLCHLTET